jgi:hypothetical protein
VSEYPYGRRQRRPPRRRGRRIALALGALALLAVVLVVGIALGKALNDDPGPAGTVTYVRTLEPLPQAPARTP